MSRFMDFDHVLMWNFISFHRIEITIMLKLLEQLSTKTNLQHTLSKGD